jgi:hypothetical protein
MWWIIKTCKDGLFLDKESVHIMNLSCTKMDACGINLRLFSTLCAGGV